MGMIEKSEPSTAFYRLLGPSSAGGERVESLPTTAGPWHSRAQHGGPPAALMARAVEALPEASGRQVGRFTMELLGPIPVAPLRVSARMLRPGRSVALVEAELVDEQADRPVALARAWLLPREEQRPASGPAPDHRPGDGVLKPPPESWHRGYLDAVTWRWIDGSVETPGSAVVWARCPAVVEGESPTGLQRLLALVDSASGISAVLDPAAYDFLNTELTVHLLRDPTEEWLCIDARTEPGDGAVGVATAVVSDTTGPLARSTQTLLLVRRDAPRERT